ncbi:MAG: MFS transporter [Armatimonadota bacterium]
MISDSDTLAEQESAAESAVTERSPASADQDDFFTPLVIRRNMISMVLLNVIFNTGYAEFMIASNPLFVFLHASDTLIGIISGFAWVGLPAVFLSPFITRRFRQKKWYLFVAHIPYLGSLGLIGLGLLFSKRLGLSDSFLLTMVVVLSASSYFFGGFVTLPNWEFSASCVPMSHRGRFYGYGCSVGCLLGLVANYVGIWILGHVAKPQCFGYLFAMTWIICQAGFIAALFAKEKPTPVEKAPKPWSKMMVKAVIYDKPYLRVLTLYLLFYTAFVSLINNFVQIYGFRVLHMPAQAAGVIGIIQKLVSVVLMYFIGRAIDGYGPKHVVKYSSLVMVVALLPLVVLRNQFSVYFCAGIGIIFCNLMWAGFMPLFYGLPKPENRAGHFTAQIVAWYAAMSLGPIFTGVLCDKFGYMPTFTGFLVLAVIGVPLAMYMLAPLSDKAQDYA